MTRFLPSQVPAQITAASRLRKTTCFNIRKNSGKISLTRTCKSDIIGNSLCGHGGIGRRVRFRFLWSQGCAGSSPVVRTKKRQSERVVFFHAAADLKQNYVLSANDTAFVCPCTQQTWLTKECID